MDSELEAKKTKIILSPEVRRIRNAVIKKFADEPLDIMAKFVKDVVDNEKDTVKRLGAMAARVEILRMRISQISERPMESDFEDNMEDGDSDAEESNIENPEIVITSPNLADWVRLRIVENSEINGVRFPKGVVIDVSQEDGDRLLESGKAEYVESDDLNDVKENLADASLAKNKKSVNKSDSSEKGNESSSSVEVADEVAEVDEAPSDGVEPSESSPAVEVADAKTDKEKLDDMLAGFEIETENKNATKTKK